MVAIIESDLPVGLTQPARSALAGAGIRSLGQVSKYSEADIHQLHGIGSNALKKKLRYALADEGLSFADEE